MKTALLAIILTTAFNSFGQMKNFINPEQLPKPSGYSHVVTADANSRIIFVSGQVPLNEKGELVGKGNLAEQVHQVYKNIGIALTAAGATFTDVVKISTFLSSMSPENLQVLREVRAEYLVKEHLPASTTVTAKAYREDILVEIEVIAVLAR